MTGSFAGDLADLWAVGGQQTPSSGREGVRGYYRHCPNCGWQLTGKFSTCPRCGADLRIRQCDYCGGAIPAKAEQCPRCTALLA